MTIIWLWMFNLFMLAAAYTAGSSADPAVKVWQGEYSYYASGGQTRGGSQIMMDIMLKIDPQAGDKYCELNADGYQTYDRIVCTAAVDKNRLVVRFKSYEDDRIVNEYDVARYKIGETLLSVEKIATQNKTKPYRYRALWDVYTPFGDQRKDINDYFEKVK